MTTLDATLAAIDHATAPGCVVCTGPLGDSPSDDYCGEACQTAWLAAKGEALVGYREPLLSWARAVPAYDPDPATRRCRCPCCASRPERAAAAQDGREVPRRVAQGQPSGGFLTAARVYAILGIPGYLRDPEPPDPTAIVRITGV